MAIRDPPGTRSQFEKEQVSCPSCMGVWGEDLPVALATYDGWKRHKNLAKSDKHNLSSLAPQKGR